MNSHRGIICLLLLAHVEIALVESFQLLVPKPSPMIMIRSPILTIREVFRSSCPLRSGLSINMSMNEVNSSSATKRIQRKEKLSSLLEKVPRNASTPKALTEEILSAARDMESFCPTKENEVISELGGNWELIWTAQDPSSLKEQEQNPIFTWINPLENQSYSNNPNGRMDSGRSNPILPQEIQNKLEDLGILADTSTDSKEADASNSVRSSQAIDLKRMRVRNVVTVTVGAFPYRQRRVRGSITVDVKFRPNKTDLRRVDVKFDSCRFKLLDSPFDLKLPLGPIGPTGWLRTGYIDDDVRITRGHKGSVFVLTRTVNKKR